MARRTHFTLETKGLDEKKAEREVGIENMLVHYVTREHIMDFNILIQGHLKKFYSETPFQVSFISWNHPWGIGDFVHIRDFATYYQSMLAEEKTVQMKNICLISPEKLNQAKLLLKDKVAPENIYWFDDAKEIFDPEKANKSQFIIFTSDEHIEDDTGVFAESKNKKLIEKYISKADSLVSVSRGTISSDIVFAFRAASPSCYKQSICEYGTYPSFLYKDSERLPKNIVFDSVGMGVDSEAEEVGIKFSEIIRKNTSKIQNDVDKAHFLLRENTDFLAYLIGEEKDEKQQEIKAENFFKGNTIAFGYLQNQGYSLELMYESLPLDKMSPKKLYITTNESGELVCYVKEGKVKEKISLASLDSKIAESIKTTAADFLDLNEKQTNAIFDVILQKRKEYVQDTKDQEYYFEKFTLSAVGISQKPSITIFTNQKCLEVVEFISPEFKALLDREGIGSIKTKNKTIIINPEKIRQLNLVDFTGASESDKEKLIAVSDVVAASGDSSYSDVFSAGKFPFFQSRAWKFSFFAGILNDIQRNCPELKELSNYLKIMLSFACEYDSKKQPEWEDVYKYQGPWILPSLLKDYEKNNEEYLNFIKKHHRVIQEQFSRYCHYAYEKHNIVKEQNNIFIKAVISSILLHGNKEEIDELLKTNPTWKINKSNFVFFAVEKSDLLLLKYLYKCDKKLFLELIIKPQLFIHPDQIRRLRDDRRTTLTITQYTPIEMMILNNNIDMINMMLGDLNLQNLFTPQIVLLAREYGKLEAAELIKARMCTREMNRLFDYGYSSIFEEHKATRRILSDSKLPLFSLTMNSEKNKLEILIDFLKEKIINSAKYIERLEKQGARYYVASWLQVRLKNLIQIKIELDIILESHDFVSAENNELRYNLLKEAIKKSNHPLHIALNIKQSLFSSPPLKDVLKFIRQLEHSETQHRLEIKFRSTK